MEDKKSQAEEVEAYHYSGNFKVLQEANSKEDNSDVELEGEYTDTGKTY